VALDLSGTATITFECWFYWVSAYANNDDFIAEFTTESNTNAGFYIDPNGASGNFVLNTGGSGGAANNKDYSRSAAPVGVWHHLIAEFDRTQSASGEVVGLWINSVSLGSVASSSGTNHTDNFANSTLYIGSRAGSNLFGNMYMRHLAIYSSLLSQSRINVHYEAGRRNGVVTG
jgi:hypothetical protein